MNLMSSDVIMVIKGSGQLMSFASNQNIESICGYTYIMYRIRRCIKDMYAQRYGLAKAISTCIICNFLAHF